jgi:hypothetical protein
MGLNISTRRLIFVPCDRGYNSPPLRTASAAVALALAVVAIADAQSRQRDRLSAGAYIFQNADLPEQLDRAQADHVRV